MKDLRELLPRAAKDELTKEITTQITRQALRRGKDCKITNIYGRLKDFFRSEVATEIGKNHPYLESGYYRELFDVCWERVRLNIEKG